MQCKDTNCPHCDSHAECVAICDAAVTCNNPDFIEERKKMNKAPARVVIVVNGGVVTNVYSDDPEIEVDLLDYDEMKLFDEDSEDGDYCHYLILEDNIEDMTELEIN